MNGLELMGAPWLSGKEQRCGGTIAVLEGLHTAATYAELVGHRADSRQTHNSRHRDFALGDVSSVSTP